MGEFWAWCKAQQIFNNEANFNVAYELAVIVNLYMDICFLRKG
ncbi:hypothetical protein ACNKHU_15595 [Shigella flexneri]